jgi:Flp pilus assembly protein TadD
VLTLLTDSLMASGKQSDAIGEVKALRASGGGSSGSSGSSGSLGDVELGMLQAKLLAQWRGHSPEAIQLYEELCEANPDDFRPFLGRGLLLKAEGRMADAQRMFVQARFLAPPTSKATVEALIKGADVKN